MIWSEVALSKALPLTYGKSLPKRDRGENGAYAVFGSSGEFGRHTEAMTVGPSIVIGRKGAAGSVRYASEPSWIIDTAYYCEKSDICDLKFGFYLLHSLQLVRLDRSTAIPSLSRDDYNAVSVRIPSKEIQEQIVSKIEELFSDLDAGIASLERARAKLKRYRASVLKSAVEGRLTQDWRAKNTPKESGAALLKRILKTRREKWEAAQLKKFAEAGKAPPKDWKEKYPEPPEHDIGSRLPIPTGWCQTTLGRCFHVAVGATPSRKEASYWNGGIPWVSSGEVQFCRISSTRETISQAGLKNSSTNMNPAGSVVLGMIGEGKTRGQVAILDIEACNNQNCAGIRVSETPVLPEFVYYWLAARYEETRGAGSGNNQPALNKSLVEAIPVPLAPVSEQEEIVRLAEEALSTIARAELDIEVQLARGALLKQAILKRAFKEDLKLCK